MEAAWIDEIHAEGWWAFGDVAGLANEVRAAGQCFQPGRSAAGEVVPGDEAAGIAGGGGIVECQEIMDEVAAEEAGGASQENCFLGEALVERAEVSDDAAGVFGEGWLHGESPNFPGRVAFRPHFVEKRELLEGVHRLPETVVLPGHQAGLPGRVPDRLLLEHHLVAVAEVIENAG